MTTRKDYKAELVERAKNDEDKQQAKNAKQKAARKYDRGIVINQTRANTMNESKKKYMSKEEKLSIVIETFFDKLVEDTDNYACMSTRPTANSDVIIKKRRLLLSLIKDQALLISKVAELRDIALEQDIKNNIKNVESFENVETINKAKEALKKAGVKL